MNGRVYDPAIGRFMSADPYIQASDNLQSYNRYAYVFNSPLNATDPSGYLGGFFGGLVNRFLGNTTVGTILSPNRIILKNMSYSTAQTYVGIASTACGWAVALCAAGGSYENSLVHGGSFSQSLRAGATAGVTALVTAQLFSWAGDVNQYYGFQAGSLGAVGTHMVAGCISSSAFGGDCGSGAIAAGFAQGVGGNIPKFESFAANVATRAVLGGVGSVLGGGKFGNGAVTAAFAYMFNDARHEKERLRQVMSDLQEDLKYAAETGCVKAGATDICVGPGATKSVSAGAAVRTEARNLSEKLTMDEARAGAGERIMQGKINDTAFPEDTWAKMQHVHETPSGASIVIHYWERIVDSFRTGFKYKD